MLRDSKTSCLNPLGGSGAACEREMVFTTTLTTVEDLSYHPSSAEQSRDSEHVKAVGRRSWKTVKGKSEAVWGPFLEATLIEALQIYNASDDNKPQPSKNGFRFPNRNRFIADYISAKTGKIRTHKQVGSRLQQMRDTCEDSRILDLINGSLQLIVADPRQTSNTASTPTTLPDKSPQASATSHPSKPAQSSPKPNSVTYTRFTIEPPSTTDVPSLHLIDNTFGNPVMLPLSIRPERLTFGQGPLSRFSNSIRLFSTWELNAATNVTIYYDDKVAHLPQVELLRLVARPDVTGETRGWVYDYDVAASSWSWICATDKLSAVTVLQKITIRQIDSPKNGSVPQSVSAVYHFEIEDPTELNDASALKSSTDLGNQASSSRRRTVPPVVDYEYARYQGPSYYQLT